MRIRLHWRAVVSDVVALACGYCTVRWPISSRHQVKRTRNANTSGNNSRAVVRQGRFVHRLKWAGLGINVARFLACRCRRHRIVCHAWTR